MRDADCLFGLLIICCHGDHQIIPQPTLSATRQILAVSLKGGGHHDSRILGIYTNYLAHNVITRALSGSFIDKLLGTFLRNTFAHAVFPIFKPES